jgi:copper(I)-binding protein
MFIKRVVCAATAVALFLPGLASAHDYKIGSLEIGHPWSRATPPAARTAAGFMVLKNKGGAPDRLVSVSSPTVERVEIHEMRMDGAVMRMRELERGIDLPAGATVELKPGGFHLMMFDLKAPLVKDQKVPVTLVFEKAGPIQVELLVHAPGAGPGEHKH